MTAPNVTSLHASALQPAALTCLPDELLSPILPLLKSRDSIIDLSSFASTCTRLHSLAAPALRLCLKLRKPLRQVDIAAVQAGLHENLTHSDSQMLASVALRKAVLHRFALPDVPLFRLLDCLNEKLDGTPILERFAQFAPEESLALALVAIRCLQEEGRADISVLNAVKAYMDRFVSILDASEDPLIRYEMSQLIVSLHPVSHAFPEACIKTLPVYKQFEPLAQLNLLDIFIDKARVSGPSIEPLLAEMVEARIADGSLFQHPGQVRILQRVAGTSLFHLPPSTVAAWLERTTASGLCPAIQRYRHVRDWSNEDTPWPMELLAAIYCCGALDEQRKATLVARIGAALEIGGWQFISEVEFGQACLALARPEGARDRLLAFYAWVRQRAALLQAEEGTQGCVVC